MVIISFDIGIVCSMVKLVFVVKCLSKKLSHSSFPQSLLRNCLLFDRFLILLVDRFLILLVDRFFRLEMFLLLLSEFFLIDFFFIFIT